MIRNTLSNFLTKIMTELSPFNSQISSSLRVSEDSSPHLDQLDKRLQSLNVHVFKDFSIGKEEPPLSNSTFPINPIKPQGHFLKTAKSNLSMTSKFLNGTSTNNIKSTIGRSVFNLSESKKMNSKFFKIMVKLYLVKKFIKKLKETITFHAENSLKKNQFEIINDFASFSEEGTKNNYKFH